MLQSQPDTLILCPTKRFARGLQQSYAQQQLAQGEQTFAPLAVQTLEQWLAEQIDQAYLSNQIAVPPRRLSQFEERYLWQSVIQEHLKQTGAPDLFDVMGLANNCIEANRYCVAWQLDYADQPLSEESQAFLDWQAAFVARCETLQALENVRYMDWQLAQLAAGTFMLPANIVFSGFDQAAPQELRLRELLAQQGCLVTEMAINETPAENVEHRVLVDEKQTLQALMAWVQQQCAAKPDAALAIVVPQLQAQRQVITDLLDSGLQPATLVAGSSEHARRYNVSLGEPLSQQPIVTAALDLLRLLFSYQFEQQALSGLLLSPFWSASLSEADARATLEARLREWLPNRLGWSAVQKVIDQLSDRLALGQLANDLSEALTLVNTQPRRQRASAWSHTFSQLLEALQWPGERVESSHEYQTREAWQQCLNQFAQLDLLTEQLSATQALALLSQLAQEQVFQPETTGEPTIQVLGIMEALSEPVDAMWVMGMNDNQWPMPARPNPLIPAAVQRAAKVANADDAVQMAFAQAIHQRLLRSATSIVFSSCAQEGEKALRASPLMQGISEAKSTPALWQPLHVQFANEKASQQWQWLDDAQGPAVTEGEHVKGGTGLIQAQAVCPAWAFYQYRLGARALRIPKQGFDAADRGELVHNALEAFWMQSGTPRHYQDLVQFTDEARVAAIQQAVETSISQFKQQSDGVSEQIWTLESARMQRLISDWLDYELERAINFKVIACEAEYLTTIEGVEVRLKIDRIHALPEGGLEIVDYKTGAKPSMDSWGSDRITNPQLPIYASFCPADQAVSSVQFGMVKTAAHQYAGVSTSLFDEVPEKRKPKFLQDFDDWSALRDHWLQSIASIVKEIKAGEAAVMFDDVKDLVYCDVLPILRLQERVMQFEQRSVEGQL